MSIMAGSSPVTALYAGAVKVYPVEADLSDLRIAWDDENMLAVNYAAASLVSDFPVAANMRIEAQADAVLLKWDAFDDSVTWTWPEGQYALVPTPGVGVYAATVKMPFALARPMVDDDRNYQTGGAIEGTASNFSGFVLNAPLYPESDEMPYAPNRPQMISGIVIPPGAPMNAPAQTFQIPALIPVLGGTNLRLISKAVISGWNSVGFTGCPLKYVVTGGTPITANPGTTDLQTTQIHYEAGQMRFSRYEMTSQVIVEWPGGTRPPAEWRGPFYGTTDPSQITGGSQLGVNSTGNPTTLWITPVDANGVDRRAWLTGLGAGAVLSFNAGTATATLASGPTDRGTHLEFAGIAWAGTEPWQFPAGNVQIA